MVLGLAGRTAMECTWFTPVPATPLTVGVLAPDEDEDEPQAARRATSGKRRKRRGMQTSSRLGTDDDLSMHLWMEGTEVAVDARFPGNPPKVAIGGNGTGEEPAAVARSGCGEHHLLG